MKVATTIPKTMPGRAGILKAMVTMTTMGGKRSRGLMTKVLFKPS